MIAAHAAVWLQLGRSHGVLGIAPDRFGIGPETLADAIHTYAGNWKLRADNGADGDHVWAVHWNDGATTSHRTDEGKDALKSVDASTGNKQKGGFYSFDNGHLVLWTKWADLSNRRLAPRWIGGPVWRSQGRLDDRVSA